MLPTRVRINEVGPREGMQIEPGPIATADKVRLIDRLSDCGLPEIEVTSFVSPRWVPQMADAEQVAAGFARRSGVRYTAVYLNAQGLARALATGRLDVEGILAISASEAFSRRNANRGIEEAFAHMQDRLGMLEQAGLRATTASVVAAFGCNFQGDVAQDDVLRHLARLVALAEDHGHAIGTIQLADTMGWATPGAVASLVGRVRERWPAARINLHLHDTRGLGLANAWAALQLGVDDFDASVGGLGGCPFAGATGATGNIATEDLVHLCHESGIATGVDLDALIDAARFAQSLVGRPLPGRVLHGGSLGNRRAASAGGAAA
jgi:hydroxymethylglutaryl-CoA lyase